MSYIINFSNNLRDLIFFELDISYIYIFLYKFYTL